MKVAAWTIRARLTFWYLAVMVPATLALAIGSWLLMRHSLRQAADTHLATRIESAHRLIRGMEHELSIDEIRDEFHEYAELTLGDGLIEVSDGAGTVWCRPQTPAWMALRTTVPVPPLEAAPVLRDAALDGSPVRVIASANHLGSRTYVVVAALPMGPATDALRRFGWVLAAFVPGVLLVAGFGGLWVSRRALAPVDRLTREVQTLTVQRLDRRLEVPTADDEIQRLATTFNDMLGRVEAGVADMARFTADAAHELRTPVTLVRTTADVALSRERSPEEYRQSIAEILKLAEQMSVLVGDLLVLARADAGVEPLAAASVDLGGLAHEVVATIGPAADHRQLSLNLALPREQVIAVGDAPSLRRLMLILIDNATRYTPAGGSVDVAISQEQMPGGRAVIDVSDTGPGISPIDRARVFDRFYRGADARQQAADGAGLGLSIAQAIVRRHEGSIVIEAGLDGHGCHVRVDLPAASGEQA